VERRTAWREIANGQPVSSSGLARPCFCLIPISAHRRMRSRRARISRRMGRLSSPRHGGAAGISPRPVLLVSPRPRWRRCRTTRAAMPRSICPIATPGRPPLGDHRSPARPAGAPALARPAWSAH
jgi:hypothetical protein